MTHILNPTTILEVSGDMMIFTEGSNPRDGTAMTRLMKKNAGVNLPQFHPENNPYSLVPQGQFGGITGAPAMTYEGNGRFPYYGMDNPITERATLTRLQGPHTAKFGYWSSWWRQQKGNYGLGEGTFNYGTDVNNPNDSSHPYANAILGNFDSYTEPTARVLNTQRQTVIEWFAQDNWKVTRKLTLDFGVRFGWSTPWSSPGREEAAFLAGKWDPAQAVSLLMPYMLNGKRVAIDSKTGITYPTAAIGAVAPNRGNLFNGTVDTKTDPSLPNGLRQTSGIKAGPRFGYAWDPFGKGKTAFRGGFGLFVDTQEWNGSQNSIFKNPPIQLNPNIYYGSFDTFMASANYLFPSASMGYDPARPLAKTMNYSFGVQQYIGFGTVLDVSYVGALGRHLIQARNLNSIPLGSNFAAKNADPTQPTKALPTSFEVPFTGYNGITYYAFDGNSSYHSLQVMANRRIARKVSFGAAWTWSKAMDYVDGDTTAISMLVNPKVWNYGEAGFDRTHILKINFVWDVPKASRLVNNAVVKYIFDDWQVSGIDTFMSGAPTGVGLSFTYTTDITGTSDLSPRPVVIANPNLPKDQRDFFHALNTAAFAAPAVGTFGNASKYVFRGPGINNWDLSSFKNLRLPWERFKMQFRGEFYNAFNHTQFSGVNATAQFNQAGVQSNAAFGNYTSARNPRRIQLALRLSF